MPLQGQWLGRQSMDWAAPPPCHRPIDVAEVGGEASALPAPRAPRTSAVSPHRSAAAWRSSLRNSGRGRGAEGRAGEAAPGLLSRVISENIKTIFAHALHIPPC